MAKRSPEELWAMSLEYRALRWKQLNDPALLSLRPYWKYVSNKVVGEPCHTEWDGLVLPYDDPWWINHFPPLERKCHCRVTAVSRREYKGDIAPRED